MKFFKSLSLKELLIFLFGLLIQSVVSAVWGNVIKLTEGLLIGLTLLFIMIATFFFAQSAQRLEKATENADKQLRTATGDMDKQLMKMADVIDTKVHLSTAIESMGIVKVYERLDMNVLKEHIAHSKKQVLLSDNWLFPPNVLHHLEPAFLQAASQNAELHILLINPKSPAAIARSHSLYGNRADLKKHVEETTKVFQTFQKNHPQANLMIKWHDLLPSIQIFLCDNLAIVGIYFHGADSQECTQLEVRIASEDGEETNLGMRIMEEVKAMWNNAVLPPPLLP